MASGGVLRRNQRRLIPVDALGADVTWRMSVERWDEAEGLYLCWLARARISALAPQRMIGSRLVARGGPKTTETAL